MRDAPHAPAWGLVDAAAAVAGQREALAVVVRPLMRAVLDGSA